MTEERDNNREPERIGRELRRRYTAALRCEPLADGRRDPLELPQHPSPDVRQLDSWACALAHLRANGLDGLPPANIRRAMASHGTRYASVMPRRPAA